MIAAISIFVRYGRWSFGTSDIRRRGTHITFTVERLGMQQPPLGQQIRASVRLFGWSTAVKRGAAQPAMRESFIS